MWFCVLFTLYSILTILALHWLFLGGFHWNVFKNIFLLCPPTILPSLDWKSKIPSKKWIIKQSWDLFVGYVIIVNYKTWMNPQNFFHLTLQSWISEFLLHLYSNSGETWVIFLQYKTIFHHSCIGCKLLFCKVKEQIAMTSIRSHNFKDELFYDFVRGCP
jgi:hypothetical protein